MSQENIELARRGYEAFARRDWDAVLASWASAAVIPFASEAEPAMPADCRP